MVIRHNVIQGSLEWQHLREGRYTGSNADKLLKYGAIKYSLTEAAEIFSTYATNRGHTLEPEALELYEEIYHIPIETTGIIYNNLYPNCAYSPDGLTKDILLEVKCFYEDRHLDLVSKKELPFEILAQVHFGMLICELPLAHVILYHPKVEAKKALKIFEVKQAPKIKANFKKILRAKSE